MGDVISIWDKVRLHDGTIATILGIDRYRGVYFVERSRMIYRHEFQPIKWDGDVIGNTGIGVCAAGAAGQ